MARIIEWWRYDYCDYCEAAIGKQCTDGRTTDTRLKAVPHVGRHKLTPKQARAYGSKPE